jgi:outer membrane protein assembly factor BamB
VPALIRSAGRATLLAGLLVAAMVAGTVGVAAVSVWPTYHLDQGRGANDTSDGNLGSNVGAAPAWTANLDGAVYAEPLVSGNQVLVATENDTVYSLDSVTGNVNWSRHLGTPVPNSHLPCGNIDPVGITGTPVFDVNTGVLFAVVQTWDGALQSSIAYKLYGLDIANSGNPVVNGVGITPNDPAFPVRYQIQRSALAITNGRVVVTYGGRSGDCNPPGGAYHGWVVAIGENGTGLISRNVTATNIMGGIWASAGASTDANGDLYVATGNGDGSSANAGYSDSVVRLSKTDLSILGNFTPANWATENANDEDLGSHGPLQLSGNYLYQIGKASTGYIIDRTALNGASAAATDTGLVFSASLPCSGFGGSAYDPAADVIYSTCTGGVLALQVHRGAANCAGGKAACFTTLWQGPSDASAPPILAGGRVWVRNNTFNQAGTPKLYGLNATTGAVAQTLTNGITSSVHFGTPTAAGGRLYIAGDNTIVAFGNACTAPGGYQLDGFGGLHPYCGAAAITFQQGYWQGWDIAKGVAQRGDSRSGYVLDGYGGVHEFAAGVASPPHWGDFTHAYWPGWNIARGIALDPCDSSGNSGYVVDGYGGVHEFGTYGSGLPPHFADSSHAYWPGWDIARGIVMNPCTGGAGTEGGYVLDGYGGVHAFGTASPVSDASHAYWPGWDIARAAASTGAGGGYVMDGYGGVHPFGTETHAVPDGSHAYWPGWNIARAIVSTGPGQGYTMDGYGGLHQFGAARVPSGGMYWPGWDIARGLSH